MRGWPTRADRRYDAEGPMVPTMIVSIEPIRDIKTISSTEGTMRSSSVCVAWQGLHQHATLGKRRFTP